MFSEKQSEKIVLRCITIDCLVGLLSIFLGIVYNNVILAALVRQQGSTVM